MGRKIDKTHDPALVSWVESANGHPDFPVQNLPYGIFSPPGDPRPRAGTAIGDYILDLAAIASLFPGETEAALLEPTLNGLLGLPVRHRETLRHQLSDLLSNPIHRGGLSSHLHRASDSVIHLPARIGDYTDFYVGIHHAMNVGRQFRPDNPLLSNYKHIPIGYHGRASSIRPSGEAVRRPWGQRKAPEDRAPIFAPSRRLDYELEIGVWIGAGNPLGSAIPIDRAGEHVAGFCLLNDWSARDIQAWEYQPLGPFLAKNFHGTISPWIITAEAMAPFYVPQPPRPPTDPRPLPYLWNDADQKSGALGVQLHVALTTALMREQACPACVLSRGPATNMYWTVAQMVAHHTSNGCNLNPGDLFGTGTISTSLEGGYGSLLEISRGGRESVTLPTGEMRAFLEDGDEVTMTARTDADGFVPIGFGPCRGMILPAPRPA